MTTNKAIPNIPQEPVTDDRLDVQIISDFMKAMPGTRVVCIVPFLHEIEDVLSEIIYYFNSVERLSTFWVRNHGITLNNKSSLDVKTYNNPDKIRGFEAHIGWVRDIDRVASGDHRKAKDILNHLMIRLRAPGTQPRLLIKTFSSNHSRVYWHVLTRGTPTDEEGTDE